MNIFEVDNGACYRCRQWKVKGVFHGWCPILKKMTDGDETCCDFIDK